jgi:hypothetical protein
MATRSIVTSQPDVECDVCERRLLRGEQPDVFLAAGRRHLVCELCAPRAVQEGWMRETDGQRDSQPATRPRRRRNLLERLPFRVRQGTVSLDDADSEPALYEQAPYDVLDGDGRAAVPAGGDSTAPVPARAPRRTPATAADADVEQLAPSQTAAVEETLARDGGEPARASEVTPVDAQLQQAVAAFNAGEHPRRVAGVGRALGAPVVSVRHSDHAHAVITIVIAWELCWYRYEVDLDDVAPAASATGQGTELDELIREECVANAYAQESGTLCLADATA